MKKDKQTTLVTAALPYANGKLHIGHLAGAYLPADICTRFLKLKGEEVKFICGSDENGVPITVSAAKENVEPQVIIDRYHNINTEAFKGMHIDFDIFHRTSCPEHTEEAKAFFLKLHEQGHVQRRTTEQLFCQSCDRFLPDRYVEGTCYHCKSEDAKGDQCESCGKMIDAIKLINPRCALCGAAPEVRQTDHWFFRLDNFEKDLHKFIEERPYFRDNVKRFSNGLLKQGLIARAITRDLSWGVPVPLDEAEGKVLYVWFDAPIGYISFTRKWAEEQGAPELWKKYWQDKDTKILHFIGKDNIVFHSIVWPAMLISHGDYNLPHDVVANEFLNIKGAKTSTSRNYAVWIDEYLESFAADPLRYYLTAIAPEGSDSDFSWEDFQARNNSELADNLGNFIQRNLVFAAKYFDGRMPAEGTLSEGAKEMLIEIDKAIDEVGALLEKHHYKQALQRLMKFSQTGNQFLENEKPWTTRKDDLAKCGMAVNVGLRIVEALSVMMLPFLPESAAALRKMLNLTPVEETGWNKNWLLKEGCAINKPEILFRKFEDDEIKEKAEKLN
ncbi:MAG: methionine--tRNA ligase [Planctomycetota bacterium]